MGRLINLKALEAYSHFIEQQLSKLAAGTSNIESRESASMGITTVFVDMVQETSQSVRTQFAAWEEDLKKSSSKQLEEIGEEAFKQITSVSN